mmetsp:Transcript_18999/g.56965  ORF Transcript_18999/g.56965 Transcript_18999/m.56965 type:complete len:203 (-) Transcript_18999:455-1063(-)
MLHKAAAGIRRAVTLATTTQSTALLSSLATTIRNVALVATTRSAALIADVRSAATPTTPTIAVTTLASLLLLLLLLVMVLHRRLRGIATLRTTTTSASHREAEAPDHGTFVVGRTTTTSRTPPFPPHPPPPIRGEAHVILAHLIDAPVATIVAVALSWSRSTTAMTGVSCAQPSGPSRLRPRDRSAAHRCSTWPRCRPRNSW